MLAVGFLIGKFFEKRISEKGEFYRDLQKYVISFEENVEGRRVELSKFNDGFATEVRKVLFFT